MKYPSLFILIFVMFFISCSSSSPEETYKSAIELYNKGMYQKAESALSDYLEQYPNDKNYPNALFLKGFIFANHLNQLDSARVIYNFFIKKYPDHELAASVNFELENLGKSADLLLELGNDQSKKTP